MCEKRVRARVAGMDINSVGACREGDPILVYRRAAAKLGMEPGDEGYLVFHKVEPTWPVVVQYRPWLRVSKPQTFIACGQCGADFGFATNPVPTRCHSCQAKLVGSIPQSEVAALLKREGGSA